MKDRSKIIPFLVISVLVVGLLLAFASGAKAAPVEPPLTYTGVLNSFSDTAWVLDTITFTVNSSTVIPPFYALKDTVVTTYTVGISTTPGISNTQGVSNTFTSLAFMVLNSGVGNTYTYSGTLTAINNDLWTVGKYTFSMKDVTLPAHFAVNDTVEVTFKIVDGKYVATAVKVLETFVGPKVTSSRCDNLKDRPAVFKLASELGEDPETIGNYFCLGFGIGEIRLAYHYAGNGYTPAMLLALRANGMSWGQIKQLIASTPSGEPAAQEKPGGKDKVTSPATGSTSSPGTPTNNGNGNGNSNKGNGHNKDKPDHGKKK